MREDGHVKEHQWRNHSSLRPFFNDAGKILSTVEPTPPISVEVPLLGMRGPKSSSLHMSMNI
jgi:hypothetical protein